MNTKEKIKIVEACLGVNLKGYQKAVLTALFDACENEGSNESKPESVGLTEEEIRMLKIQAMRETKIPGRTL